MQYETNRSRIFTVYMLPIGTSIFMDLFSICDMTNQIFCKFSKLFILMFYSFFNISVFGIFILFIFSFKMIFSVFGRGRCVFRRFNAALQFDNTLFSSSSTRSVSFLSSRLLHKSSELNCLQIIFGKSFIDSEIKVLCIVASLSASANILLSAWSQ